jgi:putative mRNA 3-end processing factor
MKLEFLGGVRQVGRSAVLVNEALLLDFGMETSSPPRYPVRTPKPEAVVVSHAHLDHAGAVPALLSGRNRPAVHWTPPTAELARVLARDTLKLHGNTPQLPFHEQELKRLTEVSTRHDYREPFEAANQRGGFE